MTYKSDRQHWCFVLPWSFTLTGGVNQVVENLMLKFRDEPPFSPLALELRWNSPISEDTLPTGIKRLYLRLRVPYMPEKPLTSVVKFLLTWPSSVQTLHRLARQYDICVFNVYFPDLSALNFILLKRLGGFHGKVILSLQGSDVREACQQRGLSRWLWRLLYRHADAVTACSKGLEEEVLLLEKRSRTLVCYNGVDADRFARQTHREFCLPPSISDRRIILCVAGFEYRKGHDILIRAFQVVAQRDPGASLVLIGRAGPQSSEVRRLISDGQLESRVLILEDVPHTQICDFLTRAAVFVLASRWQKGVMGEGLPIAILEAAAVRTPVVSTATCGVTELISDGVSGRVVPLEDAHALAAALLETLNDPVSAGRMAENLYAVVRENFNWHRTAAQFRSLCESPA